MNMSESTRIYWPETEPIENADFVSHDNGETWHPLCECGREYEPLRRNPWANFECTNYDAHCGLRMALIWAEDWPDYDDENEDD